MDRQDQKRSFLRKLGTMGAVATLGLAGGAAGKQTKTVLPSNRSEDEAQVAALLVRWGYARDSDDWETLSRCFHEGATIKISWISAAATDFVERSKAMAAARKPGSHLKHIISPPWIRINNNKAFTRTHATLYIRENVEGHEVDITSWIRFFDFMERRENGWGIVKRMGVYEKDRMDPVDPRGFPPGFFDGMDLSRFPASAKFLCYWLQRIGRPSSAENIVSVHSDGERALLRQGEDWLASAK